MSGRLPWEHPFQPDPLTPTACVICALHPQWHTPRPILYDDPASVERLALLLIQWSEFTDGTEKAKRIIDALREGS